MPSYQLVLISPEGTAYESEVDSIVVPGREGFFGVLANHAPMVVATQPGAMTLREPSGTEKYFAIGNGVVEVENGSVTVLTGQTREAASLEEARNQARELEPLF